MDENAGSFILNQRTTATIHGTQTADNHQHRRQSQFVLSVCFKYCTDCTSSSYMTHVGDRIKENNCFLRIRRHFLLIHVGHTRNNKT